MNLKQWILDVSMQEAVVNSVGLMQIQTVPLSRKYGSVHVNISLV